MDRRNFLQSGGAVTAASALAIPTAACAAHHQPEGPAFGATLKGDFLDLTTPAGNREAWARLSGNTDMKSTKYGWYSGIVQGVRPGEAIRDLVGFTGFSAARLIPNPGEDPGYMKLLREIGFYTDLKTGEILEEWHNPYLDETVKVVPVANDPFNHTITNYYPAPPSYGGLNQAKPPKIPMVLDFTRRGDTLNWLSHINLFYPSALHPMKWQRESGSPFVQATEVFLYQIDWHEMQDPSRTSVEHTGSWNRTTPWLPWMLMGPTPGHCAYHCFMGASDSLDLVDPKVLAYTEKNFPKFLESPGEFSPDSLSSLENYAREQTPAPVGPDGPPIAPAPELPGWFKAMTEKTGGAPAGHGGPL